MSLRYLIPLLMLVVTGRLLTMQDQDNTYDKRARNLAFLSQTARANSHMYTPLVLQQVTQAMVLLSNVHANDYDIICTLFSSSIMRNSENLHSMFHLIESLKQAPLDFNVSSAVTGKTIVHTYATQDVHPEFWDFCLAKIQDINSKDNENNTALLLACSENKTDNVIRFIQLASGRNKEIYKGDPLDVNYQNKGMSPLLWARAFQNAVMKQQLLWHGAKE